MEKVISTKQSKMKNLTIKKHSAAVHISCNLTAFQRTLWDVLFAWAIYTNGEKFVHEEYHEISFSDLARCMGFDSNNIDFVHNSLTALLTTSIRWNILKKDKVNDWDFVGKGAVGLLSFWDNQDGRIRYSYHPALRERLLKPNVYAKINLKFLQNFDSKYSIVLYELLVDYWNQARRCSETPFIDVKTLYALMGMNESDVAWKYFSRDVLYPAIEEIEKKTPFRITQELLKEHRKITAIKFTCLDVSISNGHQQESLFTSNPNTIALFKPKSTFTFRDIPVGFQYRLIGQETTYEKMSDTESRIVGKATSFKMVVLDTEVRPAYELRK